jgi:uncharacterized protein
MNLKPGKTAMSVNFFPKVVKFFELFDKQSGMVREATLILESIFTEFRNVPDQCEQINRLETEGDSLAREISTQLSLTFITPIDREDIHAINMAQEELLDVIRAISSRIGLYKFAALEECAVVLVKNLRQMVDQTNQMLKKLNNKQQVNENIAIIKKNHYESELLLLVALGELYEADPALPENLLHVIKWSQIYDRIEQALNKADLLCNIIEGISIKNA